MKNNYGIIRLLIALILVSVAIIPSVAAEGADLKVQSYQLKDKCYSESNGKKVCVGHPTSSDINFMVDYLKKTIKVSSKLTFRASPQSGKVFFFFDPIIRKATLNNKQIKVERKKAPGNEDWIIVLPIQQNVPVFKLELEYEITGLTSWGLNWSPFWWRTDYSDSSDARFINVFAPASFEADRYPMVYTFEFHGLKNIVKLYTSASEIQKTQNNIYRLKFSDWNNMATPYFEFTSLKYHNYSFSYKGKYQSIPVTIYLDPELGKPLGISGQAIANDTENLIRMTIDNFENTMGQYPFDKLLVKLYSLQKGDLPLSQEYSMEYGGAVVSRLELVPHEICHQWFGRGASPQDGQAGFIDELICDWYDYNNPLSLQNKIRKPLLLSSPNSFTLRTPEEAYQKGLFFAEISYLYQQDFHDIYTFLKKFYQKFRLSAYSREDFTRLLNEFYTGDLEPYFLRYIYRKESGKL